MLAHASPVMCAASSSQRVLQKAAGALGSGASGGGESAGAAGGVEHAPGRGCTLLAAPEMMRCTN